MSLEFTPKLKALEGLASEKKEFVKKRLLQEITPKGNYDKKLTKLQILF